MGEEQASDKDEFDPARSLQLSAAISEQSSRPTPSRQSKNKRQLQQLNVPPPLSSASFPSSSAKSAVSDTPNPAKKPHHEPASIYSSVANRLETLVRDLKTQYEKNPEGHWEKIRYEAAEFSLTAIRLAPTESAKEYVAREVGGKDVTPLSCRDFTDKVEAILSGTVRQRSADWQMLSEAKGREILKRDDYCCLISGRRDNYAQGLLLGEPQVDDQGSWLFEPFPLAPWFRHKEEREMFWKFASGIMGDPALEKYSEWDEPMDFQEHFIVLEPSIASEFNRYTLALDGNPGSVEMGSPGPTYEIKLNEHSIPQIPLELPASRTLMNVSLSNPDQVTLLSFHSFIALLLRESAIGKTWVADPEWNSIDDIEQEFDFTIPHDEKKPEEFLSEEELEARREAGMKEQEEMLRSLKRNEALKERNPNRKEGKEDEETESFADFFRALKKGAMEEGSWRKEWDVFDQSGEEDQGKSVQ